MKRKFRRKLFFRVVKSAKKHKGNGEAVVKEMQEKYGSLTNWLAIAKLIIAFLKLLKVDVPDIPFLED